MQPEDACHGHRVPLGPKKGREAPRTRGDMGFPSCWYSHAGWFEATCISVSMRICVNVSLTPQLKRGSITTCEAMSTSIPRPFGQSTLGTQVGVPRPMQGAVIRSRLRASRLGGDLQRLTEIDRRYRSLL